MDLHNVMAIKSHFTAEHCRRITWAIIDDGRSYFDNVKTTLDFKSGNSIVFPQLFLLDIIRNVRYGILVERANFPDEWLSKKRVLSQDPGHQTPQTPSVGSPAGTRGMRGPNRAPRAVVTNNTGDNRTSDKAYSRDPAHKAAAMAGGITQQTVTRLAPGMPTGTTSNTRNSKR